MSRLIALLSLLLALLVAMPAEARPKKLEQKLDLWAADATELALNGELEKARKLASKVLRKDPEHPIAHFALGMVIVHLMTRGQVSEEDLPQARQLVDTSMRLVVERAPGTREAAMAATVIAGPERAALLPPLEVDCPAHAEDISEAEAALSSRDLATARAAYGRALEGCPEDPALLTWAGDAWFVGEEYHQAIDLYERAIDAAPCAWTSLRFLADARLRVSNPVGAVEALTRAVGCNPDYELGWQDLVTAVGAVGGVVVRPKTRSLGARLAEDGALEIETVGDDPTSKALKSVAMIYGLQLASAEEPDSSPLARRAAAVAPSLVLVAAILAKERETLDFGDPRLQLWLMLGRAHRAGTLRAALLVLTLDELLLPELLEWHEDPARRQELAEYVESMVIFGKEKEE